MELKGANIIITGGSRGIGKATARQLAENGANVLITGRNDKDAKDFAAEIGGIGVAVDVATQEGVNQTYEEFFKHFDRLDVLINNAGIASMGELDELDLDEMRKVFDVNVFGATMMGKKAAKIFKEQKSGNIVNIGSTAGTTGMPGGSAYVASKFALRGLSESWKKELRPYNVRVFQINPSEVKTAFNDPSRQEKEEVPNKLRGKEIAHTITACLTMDNRGMMTEMSVIATNPWD